MSHVTELLARDSDELTRSELARIDEHLDVCAECRGLRSDLGQIDALLRRREPPVARPSFDELPRAGRSNRFVLAAVGGVTIAAFLVLAPALDATGNRASQSGASPAVSVMTTASPTATALLDATFENPALGYRITLPAAYRRVSSTLVSESSAFLGRDIYTPRSEGAERAACLQDAGDMPGSSDTYYLRVEAYRAPTGTTPTRWAGSSGYNSPRTSIEAVQVGGHAAARLVEDGASRAYVVGVDDRMYVITSAVSPTQLPLDTIAMSLRTGVSAALPAASATPAPADAAAVLARSLAAAFAARDADGVGRLMPTCRFAVTAMLDGQPRGGALNRSVAAFIDALRTRLTSRALTVTVSPEVHVERTAAGERYYVASDWAEPDRTTRIDLYLDAVNGRWAWTSASHHYAQVDLGGGRCIPYRSPWVDEAASC